MISRFFVGPIAAIALNNEMLTQVFRKAPKKKSQDFQKQTEQFTKDAEKFKKKNNLNICQPNLRKLLAKASRAIDKELDLVKFLEQRRMTTFAILASLSSQKRLVTQKLSTLMLNETTSATELSHTNYSMTRAEKLATSHL